MNGNFKKDWKNCQLKWNVRFLAINEQQNLISWSFLLF